jgi:type IV pilus assembly protein PilQ
VGSDISIKTRDFSGNIIDQFYATGSIIRVTPYIYEAQGIEYCLLDLDVERSSGFPSELSTEIKRTSAKTQILMVNGKQTVIGGLYLNEDKTVRNGIPILKDLPWWVLGIRYLTGSDEKTTTKKELVIVIKVDLIPRIKERIALPNSENPVKEEINRNQEEIKFYKFNSTEPKKD